MATVTTAQSESSVGSFLDRGQLEAMSFTTMMVHLDVERDCEQRVQLALALADRFQAALIGVAGLALRPAFAAGGVVVYCQPTEHECRAASARLDDIGKKFREQGQHLKEVEWRTALELPYEFVSRETRAADLIIVGARHTGGNMQDLADPGVILLRAGRPVLVAPDTVAPLQLRRVVVAWKDTRECRRAVRDALPFLQRAKEVLLVGIGDGEAESNAKKTLSDVAEYLLRHRVAAVHDVWRQARGPVAGELLRLVQDEKADLIVAGGYGHSRLGEWLFGGVTHELLASSPVCCMLSH
ncbi:MAG TPA: universal stress protein [Bradyrhizobium sp.]|nr:universal stress protein [Bradyrhizobium sp.]